MHLGKLTHSGTNTKWRTHYIKSFCFYQRERIFTDEAQEEVKQSRFVNSSSTQILLTQMNLKNQSNQKPLRFANGSRNVITDLMQSQEETFYDTTFYCDELKWPHVWIKTRSGGGLKPYLSYRQKPGCTEWFSLVM